MAYECVVYEFGSGLLIGDFDSNAYPEIGKQFADLEGSEVRSVSDSDGFLTVEIEWVS